MASLTSIVDSAVDTTSNDPAEAPKCNFGLAGFKPRILGIGTAVPDTSCTQEELLDKFRVTGPKVRSVFLNSAIQRRYLALPPEGIGQPESQGQLPAKHRVPGLDMGNRALNECLKEAGAEGELAVLVCTEACSAAYAFDGTTSVVNSLFGDGVAVLERRGDRRVQLVPPPGAGVHGRRPAQRPRRGGRLLRRAAGSPGERAHRRRPVARRGEPRPAHRHRTVQAGQ